MNAWIIYIHLHTDIRKSFIGPLWNVKRLRGWILTPDPRSVSQVGDSCNKQPTPNNLAAAPAGRTHVDVAGDDGDVLEVQRGVDLVHEVEWRGLVVVQGEHQRQGAERLLPSGQVEDLLPALLRRAHAVQRRNHTRRMSDAQKTGGRAWLLHKEVLVCVGTWTWCPRRTGPGCPPAPARRRRPVSASGSSPSACWWSCWSRSWTRWAAACAGPRSRAWRRPSAWWSRPAGPRAAGTDPPAGGAVTDLWV